MRKVCTRKKIFSFSCVCVCVKLHSHLVLLPLRLRQVTFSLGFIALASASTSKLAFASQCEHALAIESLLKLLRVIRLRAPAWSLVIPIIYGFSKP